MSDELTITANGVSITGWDEVEVTLRAEAFPNSFAISASAPKDGAASAIVAGARCEVKLGDDLVITGYIDRATEVTDPGTHRVALVGRGLTQDLVDCSAEWPTGEMIAGDALTISQRLAGIYGVAVRLADGATAGPQVPAWNLNFGETGAEIVQRLARNAGLLAYEDAQGRLTFAVAGSRTASSGAVYGQNVQASFAESSVDGRYSDYVCCGLSMDTLGDLGGSTFYHLERDPNVARHRLTYLVVESVAQDPRAFTEQRARWEASRRAGRGSQVRVTIDSWRDKSGRLWQPNTLVPVEVPGNRGGSPLCVSEVTFRRDNGTGTTAELVLAPKEAFTPEPIVLQPVNTADIVPVAP